MPRRRSARPSWPRPSPATCCTTWTRPRPKPWPASRCPPAACSIPRLAGCIRRPCAGCWPATRISACCPTAKPWNCAAKTVSGVPTPTTGCSPPPRWRCWPAPPRCCAFPRPPSCSSSASAGRSAACRPPPKARISAPCSAPRAMWRRHGMASTPWAPASTSTARTSPRPPPNTPAISNCWKRFPLTSAAACTLPNWTRPASKAAPPSAAPPRTTCPSSGRWPTAPPSPRPTPCWPRMRARCQRCRRPGSTASM
ncbi:hypothetical protein D9M68_691060 [compost metagenome]